MTPSATIFALSSGQLPSGIAVVRISGQAVPNVAAQLLGSLPDPRRAGLRTVRDCNGSVLDHALVLRFETNNSSTGEDVLELHLHGGRAVVAAVLRTLADIPGVRAAEPGEFTQRAFLNGRIDLASAEALGDLIAAETEAQRRLAVDNATGRQGQLYQEWRRLLVESRALIEAEFDFSDEGDVPGSVSDQVWVRVKALLAGIDTQLNVARSAEIVRVGFRVAIVGAPNVGKSSLLNAMAQRDVALVTPIAGTTRDLVEVSLDLEGYKVILTDTAGLRETEDLVEQLGIERTRRAAEDADLILHLAVSGTDCSNNVTTDGRVEHVRSKADLDKRPGNGLPVSAVTGQGLDDLRALVLSRARTATASAAEILPTRERQVTALRNARRHLYRSLDPALDLVLRAEELRLAANALGVITGEVRVEDMLDAIFSRFCIGK